MTSSDKTRRPVDPSGANDKNKPVNNIHSRFIPREELRGFSAWTPGSFGQQAAQAEPTIDAAELEARVQAARQAGYQDGYRDGLAALDSFKQSFASQMTARVGQLVDSFDAEFMQLEQRIAQAVSATATQLARHVVRGELKTHPELVARVAQEALAALLFSAQHVCVRVHPDDHPLVAEGAAEALAARGARLVPDPSVQRGGCRIDSDIASVDATVATRWRSACAALGHELPLDADGEEAVS